MRALFREIRLTLRRLARAPTLAGIAVMAFALGIAPVLGRGLRENEMGPGHPVVLISDAL